MNPYFDIHVWKNLRFRAFSESVESSELVWHRDTKDRVCVVLYGEGWQFQMDNEFPVTLKSGDSFAIQKDTYHRLMKGNTNLILIIKEFENEFSNEDREHFNENDHKANSQVCSV